MGFVTASRELKQKSGMHANSPRGIRVNIAHISSHKIKCFRCVKAPPLAGLPSRICLRGLSQLCQWMRPDLRSGGRPRDSVRG